MNIYSALIVLCTIAIGVSPFFHTPYSYQKKYKRKHILVTLFNKKIFKIAYYSFFSVLIVVCSEVKDREARRLIDTKDRLADSTIVAEIIQTERRGKDEVTKILGTYGFKLDSTNQLLIKIRDKPVAITPNVVYPDIVPRITVDSVSINTVKYRISLQSVAARSKIVELTLSAAAERSGEFSIALKEHKILSNAPITKDNAIDFTGTITNHSILKMSKIAVRIRGVYQSENGKQFTIDEFLIYDLTEKNGGRATVSITEELKEVFK